VKIHPAWRALSVAAVAFALASAWRLLGERQEADSRRDYVRRMLDVDLVKADILAARLAADFDELEWTARLRETTHTLVAVPPLLQQKRAEEARTRLAPIVAEPDAPAVAHFLYGRALIQLGETAAGEAEKAKARELAPESLLFRRSEAK
jgi:hypothetical protein